MHSAKPDETIIVDDDKGTPTMGIPDLTDENPFGFKPGDFKFESGIGKERAHKLAERFKPVMEISQGGMGKIVLAKEILSGRYVALKVMLDHALTGEGPWTYGRRWKPAAMEVTSEGWWPLRWCLDAGPRCNNGQAPVKHERSGRRRAHHGL